MEEERYLPIVKHGETGYTYSGCILGVAVASQR